ncbi:DUF2183 domain-containing protein [Actinomycetaceae bacterium WB03_NA08]|uniref:DUF2183 domain-containing protein n=1 Tax=Scrofimicrobium canadense TaxID=2652290 RepID=A0A6N7VRS0_9ACTO|nr:phosphatase domain-containing protein [Scrofimicrobium canadense]MSS84469.1 DUF2183 domain-containing protein [Scrofimicrobium canadense]
MFVGTFEIGAELFSFGASRYLELARWFPSVLAFGGYGNEREARVMCRTLMAKTSDERDWLEDRRGWRQYFDIEVPRNPVLIELGGAITILDSDGGGYIDATIRDHGLAPGWHAAHVHVIDKKDLIRHKRALLQESSWTMAGRARLARRAKRLGIRLGPPVRVPVRIIGDSEKVGIISDVDDTIVVTDVPRPLLAARNAFVTRPSDRKPVPGMAHFLQSLRVVALRAAGTRTPGWLSTRADEPVASIPPPAIYLSTGAWNTAPMLRKFLRHMGFPLGTVLLRPWGITDTGFPPSGIEHKLGQFARLTEMVPHVKWLLLGDDGQHDPLIFTKIGEQYPDRVAGVFLHCLSKREHVLAHGSLQPMEQTPQMPPGIPVVLGDDGFTLTEKIHSEQFEAVLSNLLRS